jgi:NhaP-type Na+/H+ or K+/H+ antiporter
VDAQPWILAAAGLLIAGVVTSKTSSRFGVPSLLLFLGIGMLAGSDGIVGIEFDDFELARSFGIVALAFILFSGGLGTNYADIKPVLGPGVVLASVGVVLTAGLLGVTATVLVGLPIEEGLLLGAVIASTDAAAVFSILRSRGVRINERLGSMLELESGSNDPAAVFLTIALITVVTDGETEPLRIIGSFALQMTLGAVAGVVLARIAVWAINRLDLDQDGLYSVLTFAFVLLTLEGVTYIGGSGFLALYVAGVTLAHHDYIHKRSLIRFHDAIAWLMQIAMFVLLGLLVYPSNLPEVALASLATAAVSRCCRSGCPSARSASSRGSACAARPRSSSPPSPWRPPCPTRSGCSTSCSSSCSRRCSSRAPRSRWRPGGSGSPPRPPAPHHGRSRSTPSSRATRARSCTRSSSPPTRPPPAASSSISGCLRACSSSSYAVGPSRSCRRDAR